MSDTPRTEAAKFSGIHAHPSEHYVDADFARELERECNKLKRENHSLRADKARLDWLDAIPCQEKWELNLAHKCVFLCRNSSSGKGSIREAIDSKYSVLPNAPSSEAPASGDRSRTDNKWRSL